MPPEPWSPLTTVRRRKQALRNVLIALAEVRVDASHVARLGFNLADRPMLGAGYASAFEVWGANPTAVTVLTVAAFARPGVLVGDRRTRCRAGRAGMTLRRPTQDLPDDVADLLAQHLLRGDYDNRPAYQRNDYLARIARAKRPETRQRVTQMQRELQQGGAHMGMRHPSS